MKQKTVNYRLTKQHCLHEYFIFHQPLPIQELQKAIQNQEKSMEHLFSLTIKQAATTTYNIYQSFFSQVFIQ